MNTNNTQHTVGHAAWSPDYKSSPLPPVTGELIARRSAAACSAVWLPPETAPKNETCIIANFGWPWPVMAIWCFVQEEWAIAQLAPCSEDDGRGWETEWEKGSSLLGWMPLPSLPYDSGVATAPPTPVRHAPEMPDDLPHHGQCDCEWCDAHESSPSNESSDGAAGCGPNSP